MTTEKNNPRPNEAYLKNFLKKLIEDTQNGNLDWTIETQNMLMFKGYLYKHPAMDPPAEDSLDDDYIFLYRSPFSSKNRLGEYSLRTSIDSKNLFFVQILNNENKEAVEVYFTESLSPITHFDLIGCFDIRDSLYETIKTLFSTAFKSISPSARNFINKYLGN